MHDEMSTIPPRVNALERDFSVIDHRVCQLERVHESTPDRLTRLEAGLAEIPLIKMEQDRQGKLIAKGFNLTHGILLGVASFWGLIEYGPKILKVIAG